MSPPASRPRSTRSNPVDALRVEYRRLLLRLAARDLAEGLLVDETAAVLADLAGGALETALQIARNDYFQSHPGAADCRLAIVAMGKCGGRELNYVSDVDVLFVAEPLEGEAEAPALKTATQLAAAAMRICSAHTAEGTLWPVDAALRPEGKSGPLVRTLDSHLAYYQRWAKTWEFQALLKARPIAGDAELGRAYAEKTGRTGLVGSGPRRLRRRRPGDAPPGRRPHPGSRRGPATQARPGRSAGTSSSQYSSCSWCTAEATRRYAAGPRWSRWSS